ncbi:cytochrome P450 [Actinokineospora cianjurensis]|uniref:Pentalenene oxygenase n=1 Tax=Actinokineospora cianjurensis TaxID=585224 RepID=A0A421B3X2_9PSEU|nr:cytochrome P450 [Actinokineospora cianjurensis]RLK59025.1 pentalenene oxygenase [Actinokineospora cianjurensis]
MANPFSTIPSAPGAVPVLGHAPRLVRDPLGFLESLPALGDLVRVRLGPMRAVVVCGVELTDVVLRDDHVFDKGGPFGDRVREFAGDGLSSCPHHLHRRQRRLVQPAFHASRLPDYARVMAREAAAAAESWGDGEVLDVLPRLVAITSRIVAATMFSDTLSKAGLDQVLADTTVLLTGMYRRMMTPPILDNVPTPGNRAYRKATVRLRRSLHQIVVERRRSGVGDGSDNGDLLSALLAAQDPQTRGRSTDVELTDQLITFFIAGAETAASTLAWALHVLATDAEVQARVRAEAAGILGTRVAAGHDTTTGRLITETMRRWPPVWMFTRTTTMATELGGHEIPADTAVIISPHLVHHRPDRYPDPHRFDLDRWTSAPTPRSPYLPFGGGPRKCVATTFALTEIGIVLAAITTRWHIEAVPGTEVKAGPAATLRPRGLRLRLTAHPSTTDLPSQRQAENPTHPEPESV